VSVETRSGRAGKFSFLRTAPPDLPPSWTCTVTWTVGPGSAASSPRSIATATGSPCRASAPSTRDAAVVAARAEEIARKLKRLESELDPAGPYAAGALPTLADCGFPSTLAIIDALLPMLGHPMTPGPRLTRWRATLADDPRFESVMKPYRAEVSTWLEAKRRG